jgi:DNA mismatch repair protein MutH
MEPHNPMPPTPESLPELLARARGLAGQTVGELARAQGFRVPRDLRRHKGFVGQLVERGLGARAGSEPEPDFPSLGVELKTIPLSPKGRPMESTYVCLARLDGRESERFEASFVAKKLARVLFVPVVFTDDEPLAERHFGMPFLWEPSAEDQRRLATDFERLGARIRLGQVERVRGHEGVVLQLRPKALKRNDMTMGVSEDGWVVAVRPRGWYLRATFTAELVRRAFSAQLGGWCQTSEPGWIRGRREGSAEPYSRTAHKRPTD